MTSLSRKIWYSSAALSALLASSAAFSSETVRVDTQIHEIGIPGPGSVTTVYTVQSMVDGRVYTASPENPASADAIAELHRLAQRSDRNPVHLTILQDGADESIIGVTEMSDAEARAYHQEHGSLALAAAQAESTENLKLDVPAPAYTPLAIQEANRENYSPTVFATMADAQRLFNAERPLRHKSQCHERAMVWAYDWWQHESTKSMKVMMFFTRKFQNTYLRVTKHWYGTSVEPYDWWYHTAPYVYVGNEEVVIDREFTDRPMLLNEWSHFFLSEFIHRWTTVLREQNPNRIRNGHLVNSDDEYITFNPDSEHTGYGWEDTDYAIPAVERLSQTQTKCRVMSNYRELDDQSRSRDEWCMVRKLPMYYHQPQSFQMHDCDPTRDSDPRRSSERLSDGRLRYPCRPMKLYNFDEQILERFQSSASQRDPDPITGR